jgi:hypothetical protein
MKKQRPKTPSMAEIKRISGIFAKLRKAGIPWNDLNFLLRWQADGAIKYHKLVMESEIQKVKGN